jgi:hypothetical protein
MAKTAGILVIGNEILSGKVVDTNSPYLCQELHTLGVDVQRICVVPRRTLGEHLPNATPCGAPYIRSCRIESARCRGS